MALSQGMALPTRFVGLMAWYDCAPLLQSTSTVSQGVLQGLYGYHTANCWDTPDSKLELVMVAAIGFNFQRSNASGLRLRRWSFDLESGETLFEANICNVNMHQSNQLLVSP